MPNRDSKMKLNSVMAVCRSAKIYFVIFIMSIMCSLNVKAQQKDGPISISIISLLANPEKYNGQTIRIVGYVSIEAEGTAIFLHREDKVHSIFKNAIALHLNSRDLDKSKKLNANYVMIEGVFDSNTGPMGLYGGSIHSVQRAVAMLPGKK